MISRSNVRGQQFDKEPVMTIPIFAEGHWSFNADATKMELLQKWGMNNRLRRISISPMNVPEPNICASSNPPQEYGHTPTEVSITEIDNQNTPHRLMTVLQPCPVSATHFPDEQKSNPESSSEFQPIAPASTCTPRDSETSKAEKEKLEQQKRFLRRKIQKREAAARYNVKKSMELQEKRMRSD